MSSGVLVLARVGHHGVITVSTRPSRAIFDLLCVLSKRKGLSSAELLAMSKLSHLSLARLNVILGVHLDVVLGEAACSVFPKE